MGVVVGEKIARGIERAIDRAAAGGHRLLLGRRADDGRRAVADADGEDLRRAGAARSRAAAVHLGAHRSDDRRRHRQLRDARRPEHRRAEGADRLRRPARHRADDPPEAARGIPAQRVPAREGHARPGGRSARDEGDDRQRAALHGRDRRRPEPAAGVRGGGRPVRRRRTQSAPAAVPCATSRSTICSRSNSSASSSASTTSARSSPRSAIPSARFRSVHIAGTNGKGSVTAMVDAALRAAGHRSARYTSPHLVDLTERFVIDGRPVAERRAASAVVADVRDAHRPAARRRRAPTSSRRSSK